jgi:alpha-1,6-mannosyltransferase
MTAPSATDPLRARTETLRGLPVPRTDTRQTLRRIGAGFGTLAGTVGLAGMLGLTIVIATGMVATPQLVQAGYNSLPGWILGPLPAGISLGRGVFTELLVAMLGCWILALIAARRLPWRLALGGIVGMNVVAMLGPPMLSTDIFNYIDYGRLGVVHGLDPYLHGAIAARSDPVFHWTGQLWIHTPTVYGPLFTLLSYAFVPLGVAGSLWAFKAVAALASIGIVLCVAGAARAWGRDPVRPALMVGANPLIVLYAVGGGHNDLLMGLGLALALLLVARGLEGNGAGAALAGAAIKASGLVAVPFIVLGAQRRLRAVAIAAGVAAGLAGLTLILFGTAPFNIGTVLARHEKIGVASSVPGWLATRVGYGLPGHSGRAGLQAMIVVIAAICLLVAVVRRQAWLSAGAVAAMAVLMLSTTLFPWYLSLALPLAALAPSRIVRLSVPAATSLLVLMRAGHWLFGWSAPHQPHLQQLHHHVHHVVRHLG